VQRARRTNNSAPMAAIQIRFCSNSFAIMRRPRSDAVSTMIAPFSGKLATLGFPGMRVQNAQRRSSTTSVTPPPGLAFGEPDDRLQRYPVIAAVRKNLSSGILDRFRG